MVFPGNMPGPWIISQRPDQKCHLTGKGNVLKCYFFVLQKCCDEVFVVCIPYGWLVSAYLNATVYL